MMTLFCSKRLYKLLSAHASNESYVIIISYRVTGLYRLGKTCYLHSLLCNNSIIAQFPVQNDIISIYTWEE